MLVMPVEIQREIQNIYKSHLNTPFKLVSLNYVLIDEQINSLFYKYLFFNST
jgi:hypothetical protein